MLLPFVARFEGFGAIMDSVRGNADSGALLKNVMACGMSFFVYNEMQNVVLGNLGPVPTAVGNTLKVTLSPHHPRHPSYTRPHIHTHMRTYACMRVLTVPRPTLATNPSGWSSSWRSSSSPRERASRWRRSSAAPSPWQDAWHTQCATLSGSRGAGAVVLVVLPTVTVTVKPLREIIPC